MNRLDKQIIKELKAEIKELKSEVDSLERDRERYRSWITNKLKWFVKIYGENQHAKTEAMIEDISKLLTRVDRFYW